MCLDPRPESLFRVSVRSSSRQSTARTSGARDEHGVSDRRVSTRGHEHWLPTLTDDLDARGWTLVTRAALSC